MAYYKIKNLTHLLAKRHINKNSTLDIEVVEQFEKKIYKLNVNGEIFISCKNLPISIHKLRMKKLISVREISQNEFLKAKNPKKRIKKSNIVNETKVEKENVVEEKTKKKTRTYKKKSTIESTIVSNSTDN